MSDDFLSRWSRRKRAVAEEERIAEVAPEPLPEAAEEADEETEAEVLERLGLPDPDEMNAGDDFAAFMQAAVPEALRRRALRRLWRSNPVLACVDGLNDYDGDFTGDTVARGELKTLYEVGRGFLRDAATGSDAPRGGDSETGNGAEPPGEAVEATPGPGNGKDAVAETAADPAREILQDAGENDKDRQELREMPEDVGAASRRRMAFRFPDQ